MYTATNNIPSSQIFSIDTLIFSKKMQKAGMSQKLSEQLAVNLKVMQFGFIETLLTKAILPPSPHLCYQCFVRWSSLCPHACCKVSSKKQLPQLHPYKLAKFAKCYLANCIYCKTNPMIKPGIFKRGYSIP